MSEMNHHFTAAVLGLLSNPEPFKPFTFYNQEGDCIEFIARPGSYYEQRMDNLVTLYRSNDDEEFTGFSIKGIRSLLRKFAELPGLAILIEDGKVKIAHILLAHIMKPEFSPDNLPPGVAIKTYNTMIGEADKNDAECDITECLA